MAAEPQGIPDALIMRYAGVSALGQIQSVPGSIAPGFTAEAPDNKGAVAEETRGDFRATVDVTYIPEDGVTFPPHNGIVQVEGFTNTSLNGAYRVDNVGEEPASQDYPRRTFSLIRYLDNGVPAATTT